MFCVPADQSCSYSAVLNYLKLAQSRDMYTMSRPVKNHKIKTDIYLAMVVFAILDVVSCQSF